jgi:hypothetical protein
VKLEHGSGSYGKRDAASADANTRWHDRAKPCAEPHVPNKHWPGWITYVEHSTTRAARKATVSRMRPLMIQRRRTYPRKGLHLSLARKSFTRDEPDLIILDEAHALNVQPKHAMTAIAQATALAGVASIIGGTPEREGES